ncbi:nucleobase:cation symporter-2 family protein [Actinomycetospora termitidis]|uniref:Nucleobase:cation symporter-2 family protein n=1 Tax=Actinomycetospora termitidis TaxID=3053470 RepID=A0ABT7M4F8_9PSEU|nr:nucleobase:cation symporter-2 family protein [Actinomycetospora sp. Odt1-22]MDL5155559.1 nucleobase:cation symporter-2 family protein [Actinomycetospora sp. Odt1-22]
MSTESPSEPTTGTDVDVPGPRHAADDTVRPEDERASVGKAGLYGLQHILAMYAGVVSPPIIIGGALGLGTAEQAVLVTAALFVSGLGTLLQSLGIGPAGRSWIGAQLPLVQGVSFAAVGTMTAVAADASIGSPEARLATIFGAVIVAGVVGFVIAPLFASLVRYFPPVVTGTVITVIGLSLFPVALRWIRGNETITVNGARVPNPAYGSATSLALGALTLLVTLLAARFAPGFWSRMAVLLGLVFGTLLATVLGLVNWGRVAQGPIVGFPTPFAFGAPLFSIGVIVSMTIVILVIMAETTADILAVGEILGTRTDRKRIAAGLRADMGATAISPVFNGFPISAFAQNVGMVAITGIRSRYVVAAGGGILVLLGLLPVLGRVMNAIPLPVLGGAGIVLFGSVAAAGIRTLSRVEFTNSNILIVAASIGLGIVPITVPEVYDHIPEWLGHIVESGISAAAITAVVLNLVFNGRGSPEEAPAH